MQASLSDSERRLIKKLHEREHFLEQVANHTPDILYVLDLRDNKFTYTNKRVQEMMGAVNIMLDQVHPDDLDIRAQHLMECVGLKKNEIKDVHIRMKVKNGEWHWFWIRDVAFKFDQHGRATHTLGVMRDIQENRKWARALSDQEVMLDKVLNAQSVSIVAYKSIRNSTGEILDFEFVLVSRSFEEFHNRYDLVGKRLFEEFPMVKHLEYDKWKSIVDGGENIAQEVSFPNSLTGKMHYFSLKMEKLGDGLVAVWEDITSRWEAEKKRKETYAILESVANAKTMGVVVYRAVRDIHGKIEDYEYIFASRSAEQFQKRSDLVGLRLFEQYPFVREVEYDRLQQVVETGEPVVYERTFPSPEGQEHWFRIKLEKHLDGVISIWEDVTEQKMADRFVQQQTDLLDAVFKASSSRITAMRAIRANGKIVDFEYSLTNFLADDGSSLAGKKLLTVRPGLAGSELFERLKRIVETGKAADWQQQYSHGNTSTWFHMRAVKFGDGFVSTGTDLASLFPETTRHEPPSAHLAESAE